MFPIVGTSKKKPELFPFKASPISENGLIISLLESTLDTISKAEEKVSPASTASIALANKVEHVVKISSEDDFWDNL